jgi:hypothetical protein
MRRITANGRTYLYEYERPMNDEQRVIYDAFLALPPSQDITPLGRSYHAGRAGKTPHGMTGLDIAAWRAGRSVFFQGVRP